MSLAGGISEKTSGWKSPRRGPQPAQLVCDPEIPKLPKFRQAQHSSPLWGMEELVFAARTTACKEIHCVRKSLLCILLCINGNVVFRFSTPSKQIPPAMGCLRRLFSRESRQPTAGQGCSSFKSLGVVRNPQAKPPQKQYPGPHSLYVERICIASLFRISEADFVQIIGDQSQGILPNSSLPFFLQCIPVVLQQTKCIYTGPGDFYIHMYPLHILVSILVCIYISYIITYYNIIMWVCLKIVYPYTQWLMIIIPTKWL